MNIYLTTSLFWFLLGIFFLLVEITHYGFIFFFFGIGAFIVAIATWIGITDSLTVQLSIFISTSLLSLILFRHKLSNTFKGRISGKLKAGESLDDIRGENAVVVTTIEPNKLDGKVEFHGTIWDAQSDEVIEIGSVVEIIERINLTFKVKPIKK